MVAAWPAKFGDLCNAGASGFKSLDLSEELVNLCEGRLVGVGGQRKSRNEVTYSGDFSTFFFLLSYIETPSKEVFVPRVLRLAMVSGSREGF